MRSRPDGLGRLSPWAVVASIAGVGAFALGQPLLDLLGRNPEFFIARRFPAVDIGLLALALLLTPVLLAVPVLLLRSVSPRLSAGVHLVVLGGLAAVAVATVLVSLDRSEWPTALFVGVAGAVGVLVAAAFAWSSAVRTGLIYLGIAPVVFGLWFALATPTSDILFLSRTELPEALDPSSPVPVVMIVFDELPHASLMLGDGSLDAEHHPNFARLAADGVWYRNAVGVRQQTEEAVPTILTGRAVSEGSIPIASDHPFTMFSLLSGSYDVEAVENVTQLCPTFICGNVSRPVEPVGERWDSVVSDLAVVYGHVTLPTEITEQLPPIDGSWGGFGRPEATEDFDIIDRFIDAVTADRRGELDRFLATFDDLGSEPPLRFAHFLYPHHPWDLTADGRVHGAPRPPGRETVGWGPDPYLVAQGWQRHLIQVQWVDTMVGMVIDRLEEAGVYDEALVMVVADHGITIRPNVEHQRVVTPETVGTIAHVPLFVKYPVSLPEAPAAGTIDDVRAETVDLLPTIAEVIGSRVPWTMDGISLLSTDERSRRPVSVMLGSKGAVELPLDGEEVFEVARDKESWFPDGDPFALAPRGWGGLLGDAALGGRDDETVAVTIDQADRLAGFVPGSEPIPAYLSGRVEIQGGATGEEIVVIVADGQVAAVTRTFEAEGATARWEAMIDPALLDSGVGQVEAWLASGPPDSPALVR